MDVMRIVVALVTDNLGWVLLVRKRGTAAFMQPGGKIEPGEEARAALARELTEELAITASVGDFRHLGSASAPAANEPGMMVEAEIFALPVSGEITVQAEIEEAVWVDPADPAELTLAPLTRDCILPLAVTIQ